MGEAIKSRRGSGISVNGIVEKYYVHAGETINAGDFVDFVNGIASTSYQTSEETEIFDNTTERTDFINACALTDSKVFLLHRKYTSSAITYAYILTIDGTTISISSGTSINGSNNSTRAKAVVLNESVVMLIFSGTNSYLNARPVTISGTTITLGTRTTLYSATFGDAAIARLSDTKAIVSIQGNYSSFAYALEHVPSSNSVKQGDSLTLNSGSSSKQFSLASVSAISETKALSFCFRGVDDDNLYAHLIHIDGLSLSLASTAQVSETDVYSIDSVSLGGGKVLAVYQDADNDCFKSLVYTISGDTVTANTVYTISATPTSVGYDTIQLGAISDNQCAFLYTESTTTAILKNYILTIDGTTIAINEQDLKTDSHFDACVTLLDVDKVLLCYEMNSDNKVLAQVYGVSNNAFSTSVPMYNKETQVTTARGSSFDGVAKQKGTGGTYQAHNEQIKIFTLESE